MRVEGGRPRGERAFSGRSRPPRIFLLAAAAAIGAMAHGAPPAADPVSLAPRRPATSSRTHPSKSEAAPSRTASPGPRATWTALPAAPSAIGATEGSGTTAIMTSS